MEESASHSSAKLACVEYGHNEFVNGIPEETAEIVPQEKFINYHNVESDDEQVIDYVEELSYGRIIYGGDGQFYVVMDKDTPDFDFEKLNNVQVIFNEDGTRSLMMEDTLQKENFLGDLSIRNYTEFDDSNKNEVVKTNSNEGIVEFDGEHDTVNGEIIDDESKQQFQNSGGKPRRSRVYGACKCPECDQAFVNTARLERHLAVHQVFGSFLCPLCGKTYKYEYNLFYHWRRTCRDMNDLLSIEERKNMEVTNLRQLVEEIAQKKSTIGPLELGISGHQLFRTSTNNFDISSSTIFGRRSGTCKECAVTTLEAHLPRHYAVHRGEAAVDDRSVGGAYFCDLCGLMFRQRFNLLKHWRINSHDVNVCDFLMHLIEKNELPSNYDCEMNDLSLKELIHDLIRKTGGEVEDHVTSSIPNGFKLKDNISTNQLRKPTIFEENLNDEVEESHKIRKHLSQGNEPDTSTILNETSNVADSKISLEDNEIRETRQHDMIDVVTQQQFSNELNQQRGEEVDEKWMNDQGIIFADDLLDDDDMLMINEEGQLCSVIDSRGGIVSSGALGIAGGPTSTAAFTTNSNAYNGMSTYMAIHPLDAAPYQNPNQAVTCHECSRTFANMARLERHIAGAHSSYGTHHCLLCGNRFKYDYNLLYHLRRVCPFTKIHIEKDIREQLSAAHLKKLVRELAAKEVHFTPPSYLSMALTGQRPDLGDAVIRQQMMRAVMPPSQRKRQETNVNGLTILAPPPSQQLTQLSAKPGFADGKKCPVCSIIFCGVNILARHLRVAHPAQYDFWEAELMAEEEEFQRRRNHNVPVQEIKYNEMQLEEGIIENDYYRPLSYRRRRRLLAQNNDEKQRRQNQNSMSQSHYRLRQQVNRQRHESITSVVEPEYNEEGNEIIEREENVDDAENCEIEPPPTLQPEPGIENEDRNEIQSTKTEETRPRYCSNENAVVYQEWENEFFE